jgi:hypothetical protein
MSEDSDVLAIHDKDLDRVLREIGLLERITGSGIPCEICHTSVTKENLGYIFLTAGKYEICCDNIVCYYEFIRRKGIPDSARS